MTRRIHGRTDDPIALTQRWLERAVIGLNLCPFARAVHANGRIAWSLSAATDEAALLRDLEREMRTLLAASADEVDTTILVHPHVLGEFVDFVRFLERADARLVESGLEGVLQIASFHPDYQFADSAPDDAGNRTNRAPFPTLHLLREDSVARALDAFTDPDSIYKRNIRTMRALGTQAWLRLLD